MSTKQEQYDELIKKIKSLQKKLNPLIEESVSLKKEIVKEEFSKLLPLNPKKAMTMSSDLINYDMDNLRAFSNYMDDFTSVRADSHFPTEKRQALEIRFDQNKNYKDQVSEMKKFIPHAVVIKNIKSTALNKDNKKVQILNEAKIVGIFESTLSEYGVYKFYVSPDCSKGQVTLESGSRKELEFEGDLDECLKYIHDNHPYQYSPENEPEKDEDSCYC